MTKLEAEYIKLAIDRYSKKVEGGPIGHNSFELDEYGIRQVKEKIDELVIYEHPKKE